MPGSLMFPNVDFGFRRGNREALDNTAIKHGTFNICKDTRELFVDIDGSRIQIASIVMDGKTEEEIRAIISPEKKVYIASDTMRFLIFNQSQLRWVVIGGDHVSLADTAEKANKDRNGNDIVEYYYSRHDAEIAHDLINTDIENIIRSIGNITRFEVTLVNGIDGLPNTGKTGVIYFVDESNMGFEAFADEFPVMMNVKEVGIGDEVDFGTSDNLATDSLGPEIDGTKTFSTYIWIEEDIDIGYYTRVGVTEIDLSKYCTLEEADAKVAVAKDEMIVQLNALRTEFANAVTSLRSTINSNQTASNVQITSIQSSINSINNNLKNVKETYLQATLVDEG